MNPSVVELIVSKINEHLQSNKPITIGSFEFKEPVGHITCRDGTRISVQANEYVYCTPRSNRGPWTHVEVMMITNTTPVHFDYPENDVAAYVPIELVAQEIITRGNILMEKV